MDWTVTDVTTRVACNAARLQVWDRDACRSVHEASLEILAETGVEVKHPAALDVLKRAGAKVDGTRVRLSERLVDEALRSAPRSWLVRSRGRDEVMELQNGNIFYGTGSDCLYVKEPGGERRRVKVADVEGMAALCEKLPNIDFVMSMGLPDDVRQEVDDVAQLAAMLRGSRKPIIMSPRTGQVIAQMKRMAELCGEADSLTVYGMPAPPLTHDDDAITKMWASAENAVPFIYASAPSCGTTGPASVTGTVIVSNAEVLSGLVIHQLIKEGAPFVYGCGCDAMSMRTMLPAYCVPESLLGLQAMTDLARYYGLPSFSYAGMSDSKVLDGQWAAEIAITTIIGALSRATLLHDIGYLESGLQATYESIVMGDELVGYARKFLAAVALDAEAMALDEIKAIGPGGNHLARTYTREHHRSFWRPTIFDQTVHGRWSMEGGLTLNDRLKARTEQLMSSPREFALDATTSAKLEQMAARAENR
jgi:trimethylamine--corrinoid protein Co-methyltransferase